MSDVAIDESQRLSEVVAQLTGADATGGVISDFISAHPEVMGALNMLLDEKSTTDELIQTWPILGTFDRDNLQSVCNVLRGAILEDVTIAEFVTRLALAVPGLSGLDTALRCAVVNGDMRAIMPFIPQNKRFITVMALRQIHKNYVRHNGVNGG